MTAHGPLVAELVGITCADRILTICATADAPPQRPSRRVPAARSPPSRRCLSQGSQPVPRL